MGTSGTTGIVVGAIASEAVVNATVLAGTGLDDVGLGDVGLAGARPDGVGLDGVAPGGGGRGALDGGPVDPASADRGVVMTAVPLRIVGRRLPGSSWSGRSGIHVGVQCGGEVLGLVTGDAADAVFDIELDVVQLPDGGVDFRGAYVHGRRGERFVYLAWGEVGADSVFTMFRRLKLHLAPLIEQSAPDRLLAAKRLQAVLELTDTRGRPLAASVRPPWVTWRVLMTGR